MTKRMIAGLAKNITMEQGEKLSLSYCILYILLYWKQIFPNGIQEKK